MILACFVCFCILLGVLALGNGRLQYRAMDDFPSYSGMLCRRGQDVAAE